MMVSMCGGEWIEANTVIREYGSWSWDRNWSSPTSRSPHSQRARHHGTSS